MKKLYMIPAINVVNIGIEPLMTLSSGSDNPETQVNHEEYEGEFSSRRRYRGEWDDEEEEDF